MSSRPGVFTGASRRDRRSNGVVVTLERRPRKCPPLRVGCEGANPVSEAVDFHDPKWYIHMSIPIPALSALKGGLSWKRPMAP